jgi:hypothetical protein
MGPSILLQALLQKYRGYIFGERDEEWGVSSLKRFILARNRRFCHRKKQAENRGMCVTISLSQSKPL